MDMESLMQLLNSGGIVVLLLIAIKLGLKGEIVSRAMLRQVVRIVLEELEAAKYHEHEQ
jgi:hypothetical protein